jgi:hypothetical protein
LLNIAKAAREEKKFMNIKWPKCGSDYSQASQVLYQVYKRIMAKKYRKELSEERKTLLQYKLFASERLKDKESYPGR